MTRSTSASVTSRMLRLAVLVFGLAAQAAQADSGTDGLEGLAHTTAEQRASYQTKLMTTMLHLSDDQVEKVRAVNLDYAKQLDPILKGHGSKIERLMKGRKILEQKDSAMQQVLSAEQFKAYLDTKEEIRQQLETKFAMPDGSGASDSVKGATEHTK